ncbi:MAG TPA: hypothetical protein VFF78_04645 [Anaerolineaceae bacterium]|nr:hypothetical protein [Anaerolineaceae bacterium]
METDRELDQKIKECETLLLQAKTKSMAGWIPLLISLGITIAMFIKISNHAVYALVAGLGLLYFGLNVWRIYSAEKQKKELESLLSAYQARKAELQSHGTANETPPPV